MENRELAEKLLRTFLVEAEERLETLETVLAQVRRPDANVDSLESAYREAHSLKGAARAAGVRPLERLCQSLESMLAPIRRQSILPDSENLALMDRTYGALRDVLSRVRANERVELSEFRELTDALEKSARESERGSTTFLPPPDPDQKNPQRDQPAPNSGSNPASFLRVPTERLTNLMRDAEELVLTHETLGERWNHLRDLETALVERLPGHRQAEYDERTFAMALGPNLKERFSRITAYFLASRAFENRLRSDVRKMIRSLREQQRTFLTRGAGFREGLKDLLVQPAGQWLDLLPASAQGLAHDLGKEVDLVVGGREVEVDRRVLDAMRTAVLHLLRNAVDHGIESTEERLKQGKQVVGRIEVTLSHAAGGRVCLAVKDDGRGLDPQAIREGAVRAGLLSGQEADSLSVQDTTDLIFRSGVSARKLVTDVSGRGLGLAIVQDIVDRLGGSISISFTQGSGTTLSIYLPARLSAFRGILVAVCKETFCFPADSVDRVFRLDPEKLRSVAGIPTIEHLGDSVPVYSLADVLQTVGTEPGIPARPVVLARAGAERGAFIVDQVIGEREVLVKSLGAQLEHVIGVGGATILENGQVIPVLNVSELLAMSAGRGQADDRAAPTRRPRLLIVEDSITARVLLKSILESAGYDTETAVNGVEALEALGRSEFDAVVSDIEMPQMNGFELVEWIRGNERLRNLPIVLLTSLESAVDRKRGLEAGANAYMVKSTFNQDELLGAIRRLAA